MDIIDTGSLSRVVGGISATTVAKRASKIVLKKALPAATIGFAAKDAYDGYRDARGQGQNMVRSAGAGLLNAGKGLVEWDLWGPYVTGSR